MALVPMCCPVPGNTHRKASGSQIYWESAEQWNAACATGRVASWSVGWSAHTLHRFLRLKCGISMLAKHSSLDEGQNPKICCARVPQGVCCLARCFCRPCCKVLHAHWEKDDQCLAHTSKIPLSGRHCSYRRCRVYVSLWHWSIYGEISHLNRNIYVHDNKDA